MGSRERLLGDVLATFADGVVRHLRAHAGGEPIEIVLGVLANARSAQRLLTLDAFRRAGADVLGMVNEPSAAAFEYTHRHARTLTARRSSVIVYDLGGGTFDVTLMRIDGTEHVVETSLGISRLGGDDFDEALADLALTTAGRADDVFGRRARQKLLDEARTAKEQLKPQSRRIIMELGDDDVIVPVPEYYATVTGLVGQTLEAMAPLIGADESLADTDIAGVYLVGGASAHRSCPACCASASAAASTARRCPPPPPPSAWRSPPTRTPTTSCATVFPRHRRLPRARRRRGRELRRSSARRPGRRREAITVTRRYRAAHNVGWFRYVEYPP